MINIFKKAKRQGFKEQNFLHHPGPCKVAHKVVGMIYFLSQIHYYIYILVLKIIASLEMTLIIINGTKRFVIN